jgi:hypothetical protein
MAAGDVRSGVRAPIRERLPTFLIIGAARSGTTSLYHYLHQHPDVWMSQEKEPAFFAMQARPEDPQLAPLRSARGAVTTLEAYCRLFAEARVDQARGEASVVYMYLEGVAESIARDLPAAKLVAILRNPADRAYSAFLHLRRNGTEPLRDFAEALRVEAQRVQAHCPPWFRYRDRGFYHRQLRRYYDVFPRERIRVYLYEELTSDPDALLRDLYRFLGVDEGLTANVEQHFNEAGIPKNERLHALAVGLLNSSNPLRAVGRRLVPRSWRHMAVESLKHLRDRQLVKPPFPPEIRRALLEDYRTDILALQDLTGKNCSAWLA